MIAIQNNEVIAESAEAVKEQGYYYFPVESVRTVFTKPSRDASGCYLKGMANCFHIRVRSKRFANGAWQYYYPSDAGEYIKTLSHYPFASSNTSKYLSIWACRSLYLYCTIKRGCSIAMILLKK